MAQELPLNAASVFDATHEIGQNLQAGENTVGPQSSSGLRLVVTAAQGKQLSYHIVDKDGNPVLTQSVSVVETHPGVAAEKATTCWECGVDKEGNRQCWKVPCPVIVGPWNGTNVARDRL
jgi:hypothetical protein